MRAKNTLKTCLLVFNTQIQKGERENSRCVFTLRLSSDKWPVPVEHGRLNTFGADSNESKNSGNQRTHSWLSHWLAEGPLESKVGLSLVETDGRVSWREAQNRPFESGSPNLH